MIAEKRRVVKGKEEKERYINMNAEFQRMVRNGKKGFLSDQCKEIDKSNRMGKTSDLFKKIGVTKETFTTKVGTVQFNSVQLLSRVQLFATP